MPETLKAIEPAGQVRSTAARWRKLFQEDAAVVGRLEGQPVFWHEDLGIWGMFGKTAGRGGIERDWNSFGQKPYAFRSNIIVEINPPTRGIDQNLQGIFALDNKNVRWVLHQGRMSVPGKRITELDFINATGLQPAKVVFSNGSHASYHKVAPLDAPAALLKVRTTAFVAECSKARLAKVAPPLTLAAYARAMDWERGLSPEAIGDFELPPRTAAKGRHTHGEVWQALSAELTRRGVKHSNDRVAQYGPDIYTYDGVNVLFEIKSKPTSRDVFEAVGQLQIYERLLNNRFRTTRHGKALVVPRGMRAILADMLASLQIDVVWYERRHGRSITFDTVALNIVLR